MELPKGLKLEVIIRPDDLVVNDSQLGSVEDDCQYGRRGYDLDHALSEFMRQVKSQFPQMTDANGFAGSPRCRTTRSSR